MIVFGAFFVGYNSKIRTRRTKSEAAVGIMNWGTQKESSNIGFFGALSAGSWLFARILQFSMLTGDARPEA